MMAQPAGAAATTPGAPAALGGAPAEGAEAAGTNPGCAAGATDAAPFSLALLALAAAPGAAGALPPSTSLAEPKSAGSASTNATVPLALAPAALAGTTDPGSAPPASTKTGQPTAAGARPATLDTSGWQSAMSTRHSLSAADPAARPQPASGELLPRDLLRALFEAGTAGSEPAAVGRAAATGEMGKSPAAPAAGSSHKGKAKPDLDAPPVSTATGASPQDPGAALLATVLQWLQQQRDAARSGGPGADASGGGREPDGLAVTAQVTAVTMAAPGIDAAAARESGGRAGRARAAVDLAAGAKGAAPAGDPLTGAALPGIAPPGIELPGIALPGQRAPASRAVPDEHPLPAVASDSAATGTSASAGTIAAAAGASAGAGAGMAAALRAASAVAAAPAERSVAVPVHERHWPAALATQVLILSSDKLQAATLRLTPEHLGPVEVRIDMHDAQVNVNFTAAHAETRAALEQAMPQLRAVLEGSGLTLGQATVQQQARRESQNPGATARPAGAAADPPEAVATVARAIGIIDEFV